MITQAKGITKAGPQAERPGGAARKIVFAGAKGGVGTTQIAANLAAELGLKRNRVLFVDAGRGNAKVVLGIDPEFDLRHLASGEKSIEEIICEGPGGIGVVPAYVDREQAGVLAPWQRERLLRGLAAAAAAYDFVLCDAGAWPPLAGAALDPAEVIVVTTPEPASVAGAYATVKELARLNSLTRVQVVVNMAEDSAVAARAFQAIAHVARRFLGSAPAYLGWVPADVSVTLACKRRVPFVIEYPDRPAAAAVEIMASKLALAAQG